MLQPDQIESIIANDFLIRSEVEIHEHTSLHTSTASCETSNHWHPFFCAGELWNRNNDVAGELTFSMHTVS
jgi:hypothetical protein